VEIFRLNPNRDDRLVETKPLDPEFKQTVSHVGSEMNLWYKPSEAGMYRLVRKECMLQTWNVGGSLNCEMLNTH